MRLFLELFSYLTLINRFSHNVLLGVVRDVAYFHYLLLKEPTNYPASVLFWIIIILRSQQLYVINNFITKTRLFKYIQKNFTSKNLKFSDKKADIFHISAQKHRLWVLLEPPRQGGSDEYPQSMLLSRNKKNNAYPCKPQFYYIKVGFKGVKII